MKGAPSWLSMGQKALLFCVYTGCYLLAAAFGIAVKVTKDRQFLVQNQKYPVCCNRCSDISQYINT